MKIIEIIDKIKENSKHEYLGKPIQSSTTRDKILFGDPSIECTGIVTTCFASVEVIRKTIELGYNFIIVHEALFWNRGDHTDWLENNETFQEKRDILTKGNICVWRYHDYVHAGLNINGEYKDGIFYGISSMLGWNDYIISDDFAPNMFDIPEISARKLARFFIDKFNLTQLRVVGNLEAKIKRVYFPFHIMGGEGDNQFTKIINDEQVNGIVTMELVDYTISEYVRDAAYLNKDKCIFAVGHFNFEELGMAYLEKALPNLIGSQVPIQFIASGDTYRYV